MAQLRDARTYTHPLCAEERAKGSPGQAGGFVQAGGGGRERREAGMETAKAHVPARVTAAAQARVSPLTIASFGAITNRKFHAGSSETSRAPAAPSPACPREQSAPGRNVCWASAAGPGWEGPSSYLGPD